MRKAVYKCITLNVPVVHIGDLIDFIVKTSTNNQLDEIPRVSTVCRVSREMGIVIDLQVGATLEKAGHSTLGWDSTPIAGTHNNESHVNTGEGSYTIGVAELQDEKAIYYHKSIMGSMDNVLSSYSLFSNRDIKDVSVYHNISNTIGDRVPVNHCVVNKLSESLRHDLIELNCNLHLLDGLASCSRKILKCTKVKGESFGKETASVNFIHSLCKMRYKTGVGDPAGFKHIMKLHGIKANMIPRYVGNRLQN